MKLKPNQYIKIKDENHLKRLCEENFKDGKEVFKVYRDDVENMVALLNTGTMCSFAFDFHFKEKGYREVFEEEEEKKMRYFIVFYDACESHGLVGCVQEKYINETQFQEEYKNIYKGICITNIIELTQQDYEDFIA